MITDHIPVLRQDVLDVFAFSRPSVVVDGTLGLGGHTEALLERYPSLTLIGIDWDKQALALAQERLARWGNRIRVMEGNYSELPAILLHLGIQHVDGILLDLGLSSQQLADAARGFSFLRPGPLDMRMSTSLRRTAWDILQQSSETDLAFILKTYGEERYAQRVANILKRALVQGRLSNDAWQIAQEIRLAVPLRAPRIDPATRCFQALRIAVNGEIENLQRFLTTFSGLLSPGGRIAIISFHSLEDRLVKQAFRAAVHPCVCPPQTPQCVCGKKTWGRLIRSRATQAGEAEKQENPRARSARLRVLEKI